MGSVVTQEIDLADFHSISASGAFGITLEQSDTQRVEVTSQQNIIDDLKRNVSGGVWDMSLRDNQCYNNVDITIRIWIPDLQEIESSGSADIVINSFDSLSNLNIDLSGSGRVFQSGVLNIDNQFSVVTSGSADMVANFNARDFSMDISGSGSAKLSGSTTSESFDISGAGNIDAFDLVSDTCIVRVSGSGDLDVTVNEFLDVKISGSGNVRYMGTPMIVDDITGSGVLIDAN